MAAHAVARPTTTLLSPLQSRALQTATRAGGLATFIGGARFDERPIMVRALQGPDWLVLPAERDPHLHARALGIPPDARERLAAIAERATFDRLLIAHELPDRLPDSWDSKASMHSEALVELLGPPPADKSARAAVAAAETARRVITSLAAAAGRTAASAVGFVSDGLDPAILGVVSADGSVTRGTPVAVFHLASWTP